MAMIQSLYTGITGLKGHQERLDVIGNNIANVNTIGFKQSTHTFSSVLSETKFLGTGATDLLAGKSAQQIGQGSQTSQVLTDYSDGGNEFTGREEDVSIQGSGFFIATGNGGTVYTRDGNFSLSPENNLVLGASGYKVQGWNAKITQTGLPNINTGRELENINIPLGTARRAKTTSSVNLSGNLSNTGALALHGTILQSPALAGDATGTPIARDTLLWDVHTDIEVPGTYVKLFPNVTPPTTVTNPDGTTTQTAAKGEIEISFTKGGFPVSGKFLVGQQDISNPDKAKFDGTTVGDFMDFVQNIMGLETHLNADGTENAEYPRNGAGVTDNGLDAAEVGLTTDGRIQILGNVGTVNELGFLKFVDVTESILSPNNLEFTKSQSASGDSSQRNFTIYDSLGEPHQIRASLALKSQDSNGSTWSYYIEGEDSTELFSANEGKRALATGIISFDVNGQATSTEPVKVVLNLQAQGRFSNLSFNVNFSKMTQFTSTSGSEMVVSQDGLPEGVLERFSIGANGVITGVFSNGLTEDLAQIALSTFGNPNGLINQGGNLFTRGPSSGSAEVGTALTGRRGSLLSKHLEGSNVELTTEFTNLIATQRAYQANARTITTSDSILQELVSLIR